jgi:hypothetical protein
MNNRYTLGVIAALAFAGCGSQVAPTGGAPQSATPAKHGKSWMLPEAATGDSLYVTTLAGVKSYSYPRGKHIGTLKMFTYDNSGICSDKAGDVFIDYGKLLLGADPISWSLSALRRKTPSWPRNAPIPWSSGLRLSS